MSENTKEQQLYNLFIDTLLEKLNSNEISPKELEIVMKFLDNQNIQASSKHNRLNELAQTAMNLPFEDEDLQPLRRIK